ncbi:hypothetical protein AHF37_12029 [Paragonimus kellicotti]|nr:hypothetical protein AHF37_12029 [Paragonimus kellicotti]
MSRRQDEFYGVTVDVIGQTKVTGQNYLTDSLASSVLNRQLEKQLEPGVAKFLPDRVHFSRSNTVGQKSYRRDVPYSDIKKIYTFPSKPEVLMLCVEGDYPGGRIYQSFRCRSTNDLGTIRRLISGEGMEGSRANYVPASNMVYAVEPARTTVMYEQPQYTYVTKEYSQVPRTPSPVYVERVSAAPRERTPSPVYVRRMQTVRTVPTPVPVPQPAPPPQTVYTRPVYVTEAAPEPVILRRVQKQETVMERAPVVYTQPEPSPVIVRRQSVTRPASVVYVEDAPVQEESVLVQRVVREPSPVMVRRVMTVSQPPPPPPQQTVIRRVVPETVIEPMVVQRVEQTVPVMTETYMEPAPVVMQRTSIAARPTSGVYITESNGREIHDENGGLVLKRISTVFPSAKA